MKISPSMNIEAVGPCSRHGLHNKYEVRRRDGRDAPGEKHCGCHYFVLDLDHDRFALDALLAYADACAREYPDLARDLRAVVREKGGEA